MKKTARAHTNIALVKYWGKADEELIIPMNGSVSLTLDHFYTDTTVEFDPALTEDVFCLDGKQKHDPKVARFMNLVRNLAKKKLLQESIRSITYRPLPDWPLPHRPMLPLRFPPPAPQD